MKTIANRAPDGMMVFNLAKSKVQIPAASDIDTLVSKAAMDALASGDAEPYYKVEAIDFPANGSGGVYDGSFFKSFINVTKDRPIPGSKRGHEWASRGKSDFYTIGGRIDSNDNGKTGTAFLKIYIPPKGDETDNTGLIRDAKAGMVHFSLVSRPDFNVKTEKDEMGNPIQVRHFTASVGAERNDAMEYGEGAMAQIVNSANLSFDFDAAKALIEEGHIDTTTNVAGDDPIQNGRVYRTALRRLCSRASEEDRSALGELIRMIDKAKNGRKTVDKEELLATLKNMVANGQTNIAEIANGVGLAALVRNAKDDENAGLVKTMNEKLGDKPIEKIDALIAENKKTAEDRVRNAVSEAFGPVKLKNATKQDVDNPMHLRALELCKGLSGEELKNGIEASKKDPIMVSLAANAADGNSQINRVVSGGKTVENADEGGIPTHKIGRA